MRTGRNPPSTAWPTHRVVALAESPARWAIPVFCIGEFVRVITHPRLFDPAHTADEACEAPGQVAGLAGRKRALSRSGLSGAVRRSGSRGERDRQSGVRRPDRGALPGERGFAAVERGSRLRALQGIRYRASRAVTAGRRGRGSRIANPASDSYANGSCGRPAARWCVRGGNGARNAGRRRNSRPGHGSWEAVSGQRMKPPREVSRDNVRRGSRPWRLSRRRDRPVCRAPNLRVSGQDTTSSCSLSPTGQGSFKAVVPRRADPLPTVAPRGRDGGGRHANRDRMAPLRPAFGRQPGRPGAGRIRRHA